MAAAVTKLEQFFFDKTEAELVLVVSEMNKEMVAFDGGLLNGIVKMIMKVFPEALPKRCGEVKHTSLMQERIKLMCRDIVVPSAHFDFDWDTDVNWNTFRKWLNEWHKQADLKAAGAQVDPAKPTKDKDS